MSLIPAFEIGVWNAWIFMLYLLLLIPLMMMINKGISRDEIREQPSGVRESQFTSRITRLRREHFYFGMSFIFSPVYTLFSCH